MKVGLDASAGQMDEQRAHQHLRNGDDVARRRHARPEQSEERRKQADDAAEDDRRPHVQVGPADGSIPRQRRHPQREDNPHEPLEGHEPGKEPVRPPVDVGAAPRQRVCVGLSDRRRVAQLSGEGEDMMWRSGATDGARDREQPKTDVARREGSFRSRSAINAARPALSPACPRAPVIPPLKTNSPRASYRSVCPDVTAPNRSASRAIVIPHAP